MLIRGLLLIKIDNKPLVVSELFDQFGIVRIMLNKTGLMILCHLICVSAGGGDNSFLKAAKRSGVLSNNPVSKAAASKKFDPPPH